MRRARGEAGFTLLELLIAIAILGILFAAQVGPFQQTLASRDAAEQQIEATAAARTTLVRLAEELTGAIPEDAEGGRFALVDRSFDYPSSDLRFATTAARRMRGDRVDPVSWVRYRVDQSPWDPRDRVLIKEQLPSVAAPGVEPASAIILEGVHGFEVEALPGGNQPWTPSWTAEGSREKLPRALRLSIALADEGGRPDVYRITVTLPMGPAR